MLDFSLWNTPPWNLVPVCSSFFGDGLRGDLVVSLSFATVLPFILLFSFSLTVVVPLPFIQGPRFRLPSRVTLSCRSFTSLDIFFLLGNLFSSFILALLPAPFLLCSGCSLLCPFKIL